MSHEASIITIAGDEIDLGSLSELSPDEQVELMREWFFENYEVPVKRTPYESREGGYIYIWSGPYDAHDELSVFRGYVEDDLIESLADALSAECPVWTRAERSSDYEDSYLDLITTDNKFFEAFNNTISHIEEILGAGCESAAKEYLFGLLYINVITAIETYLSDAFINTVLANPNLIRKFVETNPEFAKMSFRYSDIYQKYESIEKEVKSYLLGLMWHNLKEIKLMYKLALDVDFPDDLKAIYKAIKLRNDLVHRNGKDTNGAPVTIREDDLRALMTDASQFVKEINEQLGDNQDKSDF